MYNMFATPEQQMSDRQKHYTSTVNPDNSPRVAGQVTVTPTQPVAEEKPAPVVNNGGKGFMPGSRDWEVTNKKDKPIDPNSSSAGMDYLNSLYTDPQEEERLRKASVMNQRILAIGDAIRHIGNIANTVNYAPAQQLNSPVAEEQARYEKGKALRDRANQQYYTYQQAKAQQEAAARRWEAEQAAKERQLQYNAARDAAALAEKQRQYNLNLAFNKDKEKNANDIRRAQIKQSDTNNRRSTGLGYANLAQRKKEFEYKKSGGGGSKQPVKLRGKNGWYTKKMGKEERDAFYNQTYYEMKNRGLIDEGRVLSGLPADMFGRKSLSQSAIKQAVDNALMQHPEVGDWLSDEYEFEFESRAGDNGTPLAPQPQTPFYSPWGGGRETIPGYVVGSSTGSAGKKETIPGFKIGG